MYETAVVLHRSFLQQPLTTTTHYPLHTCPSLRHSFSLIVRKQCTCDCSRQKEEAAFLSAPAAAAADTMDDDSALYDELEHGDNNHTAQPTLDKPTSTDNTANNGNSNGSSSTTPPSSSTSSLITDDTDEQPTTESGRTRTPATTTPTTTASFASAASAPSSTSGQAAVPINNPDRLDDSNAFFLRFRALYSAGPTDLLQLLEPQRPFTMYSYLSSQGRRTGDHFASFVSREDRDAVLSRELQSPYTSAGRVDAAASSKREQLAAEKRSRGTDKRTSETSVTLKLKGIPFSIREDGIEQWLRDQGVKVVDVHIPEDAQSGRVAGDALVEVEDEESAAVAQKLTKSTLQNRYVDVMRITAQHFEEELHPTPLPAPYRGGPPQDLRRPPASFSGYQSSRSSGGDSRDEYGAVPPSSGPLVHQLPRLAPLSTDCLFMQGLPIGCQQADVIAFFAELHITPLRIHRKERGPDAFIEFRSVDEAERAMALKRRHMGSRWIDLIRVTYSDMCRITGLPPTRSDITPASGERGGGGGGRVRDDRDDREVRRRSSRDRDDVGRGGYSDRRDRDREYDRRDDRYSGGGSAGGGDRYRERSRSPVARRRDDDYGGRGGGAGYDRDSGREHGRDSYRDARGGGASSYRDSDRGDRYDRDRDERDEYRRR